MQSLKMGFYAETCRSEVTVLSCIVVAFSWYVQWKYNVMEYIQHLFPTCYKMFIFVVS